MCMYFHFRKIYNTPKMNFLKIYNISKVNFWNIILYSESSFLETFSLIFNLLCLSQVTLFNISPINQVHKKQYLLPSIHNKTCKMLQSSRPWYIVNCWKLSAKHHWDQDFAKWHYEKKHCQQEQSDPASRKVCGLAFFAFFYYSRMWVIIFVLLFSNVG